MAAASAGETQTGEYGSTLTVDIPTVDGLRPPSPKDRGRRSSSRCFEVLPEGGLTYVDFMPMKKEDRFAQMVEQANTWLTDHPDWGVKTCESVEFKLSNSIEHYAQFEKMTFFEEDEGIWQHYARGLRIWIVQRTELLRLPQEIGYFNVIPRVEGTICGKPAFQTMDVMLDHLNEIMQETPVEGQIVTIETLRLKFSPFQRFIDPERTFYRDHGYNLFAFRIFYLKGDPIDEIIAVEDFKPICVEKMSLPLNRPRYEDFTAITRKVQDWCTRRRRDVRVCNVQTLWIKIKGGQLDTQRMFFTEHKDHNYQTHYVRIMRVAYAHPARESLIYPPQKPIRICCRTFLPVQLGTRGFFSPPNFEMMSQTRDRIAIWILQHNVRVISAETCPVRMYTGGERFDGPDATYTFNCGNQNEHWIYVFRLFLDGRYPGVPPEMDRGAFQAWNQDPLIVTHQSAAMTDNKNDLCNLQ